MLVSFLLAVFGTVAQTPLPTTTVQDTVYNASGAPASGTVVVSWGAFTTATGASVPAGSTSATIGANGLLSMTLAPNAEASPLGRFYIRMYDASTPALYSRFSSAVLINAPVS
jgi:hypothetical protein